MPPSPLPPALRPLDVRYAVLRELGRGTSSVVYLAAERATGREVAIKVIAPTAAGDADATARLAREASLVATLRHPNIVETLGIEGLADGSLAIVTAHVAGRTLREALHDEGALHAERAARVLRDVAAALAHAHGQRIVHRDVKPENVFLAAADGRALLGDFGIARSIDAEALLTQHGASLGTPAYMAPEQVAGRRVDARSDVYALGLVGWELLAGERPWRGATLYELLHRQQFEPLPDLAERRPDAPVYLLRAIEGATAKDPDARWPDARAFLERLTPRPVAPAAGVERPDPRAVDPETATVRFAPGALDLPIERVRPDAGAGAASAAPTAPRDAAQAPPTTARPADPPGAGGLDLPIERVADPALGARTSRGDEAGAPGRLIPERPALTASTAPGRVAASAPAAPDRSDDPAPSPPAPTPVPPRAEPVAAASSRVEPPHAPSAGAQPTSAQPPSVQPPGAQAPSARPVRTQPPNAPPSAKPLAVQPPSIDTPRTDLRHVEPPARRERAPADVRDAVHAPAWMPHESSPLAHAAAQPPRAPRVQPPARATRRRRGWPLVALVGLLGGAGLGALALRDRGPTRTQEMLGAALDSTADTATAGRTTTRSAGEVVPSSGRTTAPRPTTRPTARRDEPPTASPTRTAPAPAAASAGDARCASPRSADQRACLLAGLEETDASLTRTYQALIGDLRAQADGEAEPADVRALRAEQRAWLVARDQRCRARTRATEGARWAEARLPCFTQEAERRAAELEARRRELDG